jgi:hypothetical protein
VQERSRRILGVGYAEILKEHGQVILRFRSVYGTKRPWTMRQSMSALPRFSDIDLFGYCKRIVHLDP